MSFERVQQIKVGDLEIAFREEGAGEPLVLVHGWPLSSLTWRKVVPPLAASHRCIALDLPGAGQSTAKPSQALGIGAQGKILGSFLNAIGLECATLVGHDSGGSVVRSFAVAHSERVMRMVLADTEVPGHHPAFVTLLNLAARLPGADRLLGLTFGSRTLSRLGFGSCFAELGSFDFEEFHAKIVAPNARTDATRAACRKFLLDFELTAQAFRGDLERRTSGARGATGDLVARGAGLPHRRVAAVPAGRSRLRLRVPVARVAVVEEGRSRALAPHFAPRIGTMSAPLPPDMAAAIWRPASSEASRTGSSDRCAYLAVVAGML